MDKDKNTPCSKCGEKCFAFCWDGRNKDRPLCYECFAILLDSKREKEWDLIMEKNLFWIYSIEHSSWWRPDHRGYTNDLKKAGMYSVDKATAICQSANQHHENGKLLNEFMVGVVNIHKKEECANCGKSLNGYKTPDGLIDVEAYPLCEHCYDSLSGFHAVENESQVK